jgi:hypothetical protein
MLYLVLTHDYGMERWRGMTYLCVLVMRVELWRRKREMGDEDENDMENTSGYEKSGVRLA